MKLRYSYHSEHQAKFSERWFHFLLYLIAFFLLLAAGQKFFLFATDWRTSDDEQSWWLLIQGLIFLLMGGTAAYTGYVYKRATRSLAERFVQIGEKTLNWNLTQEPDYKKVVLADLAAVERPNIRDLKLTLKDGITVILPIYLITSEAKQDELLNTLNEMI